MEQRIKSTPKIYTDKANDVIGLVKTLNPDRKNELITFVSEFYNKWADDAIGRLDFHDETIKTGRVFKKVLDTYPGDVADIADVFCLAIRKEIDRIEEKAIIYESDFYSPTKDQDLTSWLADRARARKAAVITLLWGDLLPSSLQRLSYFRHKLRATVNLYQYARAFYEAHTPTQFAQRPNLPAYYSSAPAAKLRRVDVATVEAAAGEQPDRTPTVRSLCRAPFTEADLSKLLMLLEVIDSKGHCLTNGLKGKAQGKKGAFTAAYRVLHRAGLMAPAADREWAAALKEAYGADMGDDATSHGLTAHGNAPAAAPAAFRRAVDVAKYWVGKWQTTHETAS